jgi:glycosyltransferase involved in cell wall biosynthesis
VKRSAVAICTKERPELVRRVCTSIAEVRPNMTVMVIDASSDDQTLEVCAALRGGNPPLDVRHHPAIRPGLTRQRNQAISHCEEIEAEIVHFLDDDALIFPGYFDAIERRFELDDRIGGVGGAVQNAPKELHWRFNRLFLLSGKYPYTIRRSGRVVNPQSALPGRGAPRSPNVRDIQWLQGFAMSYRIEVLRGLKFNERLKGYSFGEDRDFSFRVSKSWKLAVEADAWCEHRRAETGRMDARRFGFESTVLTYAWLQSLRSIKCFRLAFFWSALGDVLRHLAAAATNQSGLAGPDPSGHARGVIRGLATIALKTSDLYGAVG